MKYLKLVKSKSDLKNPHLDSGSVYFGILPNLVKFYPLIEIPISFTANGSGSLAINQEYTNGIKINFGEDMLFTVNEQENKTINNITYYAFYTKLMNMNIYITNDISDKSNGDKIEVVTLYTFDESTETMTELESVGYIEVVKNETEDAFYQVITFDGDTTEIMAHQTVFTIGVGDNNALTNLITLDAPIGTTAISSSGFADCENLTTVVLPNTVTSIGEHAFDGCSSLTSINIPDSIISLGFRAFNDCSSLETIVLPNSLIELPKGLFEGCKSLKYVTLPNSIKVLPGYIFWGCSSLETIDLPETIEEFNSQGCQFYNCAITDIKVPSKVKILYNSTFYNCSKLATITLPDSLTELQAQTFNACKALEKIIYKNVEYTNSQDLKTALTANGITVADNAFYSCTF